MSGFVLSPIGRGGERVSSSKLVVNSGGGIRELLGDYNNLGLSEDADLVTRRNAAWEEGASLWERLATEGGIIGSNGIIYAIGTTVFGNQQANINQEGITEKTAAQLLSEYQISLQTIMTQSAENPTHNSVYGRSIPGVTDKKFDPNNSPKQKLYLLGAGVGQRLGFELQSANRQRDDVVQRRVNPPKFVIFHQGSQPGETSGIKGFLNGTILNSVSAHIGNMYLAHGVSSDSLIAPSTFTHALLFSLHPRRVNPSRR